MLTFERAGLTFPDNPPESHKLLFLITRQKQHVFQAALLYRCVNKPSVISLVPFWSLGALGMFIYREKLFHPLLLLAGCADPACSRGAAESSLTSPSLPVSWLSWGGELSFCPGPPGAESSGINRFWRLAQLVPLPALTPPVHVKFSIDIFTEINKNINIK